MAQGSLDFGVITFLPAERGLMTLSLGSDDLVMLVHPQHALAGRKDVTLAEFGARDRHRAQRSRRPRVSASCGPSS